MSPVYSGRQRLETIWDFMDGRFTLADTAIEDFELSMRFGPRDPLNFASMIGVAFGHFNAL